MSKRGISAIRSSEFLFVRKFIDNPALADGPSAGDAFAFWYRRLVLEVGDDETTTSPIAAVAVTPTNIATTTATTTTTTTATATAQTTTTATTTTTTQITLAKRMMDDLSTMESDLSNRNSEDARESEDGDGARRHRDGRPEPKTHPWSLDGADASDGAQRLS